MGLLIANHGAPLQADSQPNPSAGQEPFYVGFTRLLKRVRIPVVYSSFLPQSQKVGLLGCAKLPVSVSE